VAKTIGAAVGVGPAGAVEPEQAAQASKKQLSRPGSRERLTFAG
jgi:hypothetical protein